MVFQPAIEQYGLDTPRQPSRYIQTMLKDTPKQDRRSPKERRDLQKGGYAFEQRVYQRRRLDRWR